VKVRTTVVALSLLAAASCRDHATAPTLSATCSTTPSSGPAPLEVRYALNVAGAEGRFQVAIQYGDGTSGADVTASHTYRNAGSFTVAFDITTPTQSALCSTVVRVDSSSSPTAGPTSAPTAAPTPRPTPGGPNQAPNAVFRTTPAADSNGEITGKGSLSVELNMCRTEDPERDLLNFTMDFEGDGTLEVNGRTGGDCRRTRAYGPGTYRPRICVTDVNEGLGPNHPYQCRSYTVRVS
jgi:hypothetical protein